MKTLIALLIVGIAATYYLLIQPEFEKMQNCEASVEERLSNNNDFRQRLIISEHSWCTQETEIYQDVYRCIDQLERDSVVTSILFNVSPTKKSIESFVAEHNETCPTSILEYKEEKLYLKN